MAGGIDGLLCCLCVVRAARSERDVERQDVRWNSDGCNASSLGTSQVSQSKVYGYSSSQSNLPHCYGITQWYLPPDSGHITAFTPAEVDLVRLLHTESVHPPEDGSPFHVLTGPDVY